VTWKDVDNNYTVESTPKMSPRGREKDSVKDMRDSASERERRKDEARERHGEEAAREKENVRDAKDAGNERERTSKERSHSTGDKHRRGRSVGDGKKHVSGGHVASDGVVTKKSRGRSVSPGFPDPPTHITNSGPINVTTFITTVDDPYDAPHSHIPSTKLTEASKPIPIKDVGGRGHHSMPERVVGGLTEADRLSLPTGNLSDSQREMSPTGGRSSPQHVSLHGGSQSSTSQHGGGGNNAGSASSSNPTRAQSERERKSSVAKSFTKQLASSLPLLKAILEEKPPHANSLLDRSHKADRSPPHCKEGREEGGSSHKHDCKTPSKHQKTSASGHGSQQAERVPRTVPLLRHDSVKLSVAESESEESPTLSVYQNDSGSSIDYGADSTEHVFSMRFCFFFSFWKSL
jgi:hypothetical protein